MFFMARAAPPMLPGWLVLTKTTRTFCRDTAVLDDKANRKLTVSGSPFAMRSLHAAAHHADKLSARIAGFL
jgi:hypothetical protein